MLKLGRIPSRHDPRTLQFARYVSLQDVPASPPARDWAHPHDAPAFGMFANDRLGDCTCAAIGHYLQAQSAITGLPLTIAGADVIRLYRDVAGYDPQRPETDQGAEMLDVLTEMRAVGLCSHRFGAFVAVDPANREHMEAALNLTGWVYCGVDLPLATFDQTVWDVGIGPRYEPNSRGPHAMAKLSYDRSFDIYVTWGGLKVATRKWSERYTSEAWAALDEQWIDDTTMLSPSGFNLRQLMRDLVEIDRA